MNKQERIEYFRKYIIKKYIDEVNKKMKGKDNVQKTN